MFFFNSCTKYNVKTSESIDLNGLKIENINTSLDIIHLQLDSVKLDSMLRYPSRGIEAFGRFSYYSQGEALVSQKLIEMKNKGSSSLYYPLKSFKIKFDKKHRNYLTPIFVPEKVLPNHNLDVLKKVTLRNSGNDFFYTMIKDLSLTNLAIELDLDVELGYYKPVQVFANNEYYGLLNMRIDKDDNSLGKLLQVDNDDINILKISHEDGNEIIELEGDHTEVLEELIDAVKNEDLPYLLSHVDLNCFADYLTFEDFMGNWDWPHNNVEIYNVGPHGKFRFFLYDLDMSLNKDKFFALNNREDKLINNMYFILMEDANFNRLVKEKRAFIYSNATEDLFNQIIDKNAKTIENEIRYNIAKYNSPEIKTAWFYNIQRLKEQYSLRVSNWAEHHQLK
jgi:hypothetical protein